MYITIEAFDKYHGGKPLKLNGFVRLVKEPENQYDSEAIRCEMRHFGQIGYVSNSVNTVIKGCMSAGRIYDKINDGYIAKIQFVRHNTAIASVLTAEEYKNELKDPKSDIHYLKKEDE